MRSKYVATSVPFCGAYWTLYWVDKSSSELTGESRRDTVRKAAKLAVYEAIMMKPNSHQVAAIKRPDKCFGDSPPPCDLFSIMRNAWNLAPKAYESLTWGVKDVMQNHKDSFKENSRFSSSGSSAYFSLLFWYEYGDQRSKIHNKMLQNIYV